MKAISNASRSNTNANGLRTGQQNQLALAPHISKKSTSQTQPLEQSVADYSSHQILESEAPRPSAEKKHFLTKAKGKAIPEANNGHLRSNGTLTGLTLSLSLVSKLQQVGDVDSGTPGDSNNNSCQQLQCYVKHIYSYLQQLELEQLTSVRPDFLETPVKLEITPKMRHTLFDWLVQVHGQFNLQPETLHLTFHIVDAYLSSPEGAQVRRTSFQLLGVSALFLASKYEDTFAPSVHDVAHITNYSCTEPEIRATERRLLRQLDYRLGRPSAIQFLRRWGRVANAGRQRHELAKYLAELGQLAYPLAHLPASGLAAAAFRLAGELLAFVAGEAGDGGGSGGWSDALEVYSGYSGDCLLPAMRVLAAAAVGAASDRRHTAVRKKYASGMYLMVSTLPDLSADNPVLCRYTGDLPTAD